MTMLQLPAGGGGPTVDTGFRQTILAGAALLGLTFGGAGLWAATAPLDSAAIAPGVVVVSSNNKQIQHLEGGIVQSLQVAEGERVTAGDVLLVLDPTRARSQVDILRGQLDALLATEARLLAERDGLGAPRYPAPLADRATQADVQAIMAGQNNLFEARRLALEGQTTILQRRKAQAEEQIGGLTAQKQSQDRQIALIEDELKGLRELHTKGYAPKTRILALEREASRLLGERGERLGEIARVQQVIGETELQILQLRTNFLEQVATDLRETQTQLYDVRERLRAAEDVLARTVIRAPNAGTVVGLTVHTVGGVVPPGQTLAQVVPDQDELVIEARLQVTDIDAVRPGQEADIKFSAFKQATTPGVLGRVNTISADRMEDERTGMPYYAVRITVPEEERKRLDGLELLPGMPADAFIQTGEQTALQYLVKPLTAVIDRAFRED